jgi:Predicted hydrolases or acyltransferases (alpha/beta hydrolase superfamily)
MKKKFIKGVSVEGFHKVAYREYGHNKGDNVLFTVHGLTRNGSDFHFLAEKLKDKYCVISPDVVGRGDSGRFKDPFHYNYAQYIADMTALIARMGVEQVDWLGTSMGGLFGIIMAAQPNTPIRRLILNDIGPFVPKTAVDRIRTYATKELIMHDMEEVTKTLQALYAPFGIEGKEAWDFVIKHSITRKADGTFTLAYDPNATAAVQDREDEEYKLSSLDPEGNVIFWEWWEKIKCPVLVVNGAHSDILPHHVVEQMRKSGPKFDHFIVEGCGHAPALMAEDQIQHVHEWLDKTKA